MNSGDPRSADESERRPWHILAILLISLMPATANTFLYSFVMLSTAKDWGLTPFWAAFIGFAPLAAQPVGGLFFGGLSDRYGRRTALLGAIFLSALSAVLSGLSLGPIDFGAYRLVLGMVIGGQWAVTMTLVSEIWNAPERGRAVGIVQTAFPVGFIYASLIAFWAGNQLGWRLLLTLSGLPALLAAPLAYVSLKESSLWIVDASRAEGQSVSYRELFRPPLLKDTLLGTLVVFIGSFGAWSLNPWIPGYLGELGIAPDSVPLLTLWIMVGALTGYALYGFISDRLGRKFTFQIFFIGMALGLASFGFLPSRAWFVAKGGNPVLSTVFLGATATFFLGYFSGYGSLLSELFPTRVRGRGVGFCYTVGSIGSAIGPASTALLSSLLGIGNTFVIVSLTFLIGAVAVSRFPETRGKKL
jgi:MFS family permease